MPDRMLDPNTPPVALKPQELILTLFGEYVDEEDQVWSGGLVNVMKDVGFTTAGARIALNRVVSRGLLEVIRKGRLAYYRPTPRLVELLALGFHQTFWFRKPMPSWDERWTFVWYAIPDEHLLARRRLSRRLGFLGFGALQDGTWVAPYDRSDEMKRVIDELNISDFVFVLVGSTPEWVSRIPLFEAAWDVQSASERYSAIVDRFDDYRRPEVFETIGARDAFILRTYLIESVRQVSAFDPKIPDDATGLQWPRAQAIEVFQGLDAKLSPLARQHFDEATKTAG